MLFSSEHRHIEIAMFASELIIIGDNKFPTVKRDNIVNSLWIYTFKHLVHKLDT